MRILLGWKKGKLTEGFKGSILRGKEYSGQKKCRQQIFFEIT